MALIKCPECGRENVSDSALKCPGCGFNIRESMMNTTAEYTEPKTSSNSNYKRYIIIIGLVLVVFGIYYFSTRCSYSGCNEKKDSGSKYCEYHRAASGDGGYTSSYSYTPKTGNAGALASAESYIRHSAFSYSGLIHQLEYEGFSTSEATYGADNCGANWKEQAVKSAKSYISHSGFSESGLQHQLEYEGFTEEEAIYGVDNCGADWYEQAVKSAKSYISHSSFSRSELQHQLEYEGFTSDQASYGVDNCGL